MSDAKLASSLKFSNADIKIHFDKQMKAMETQMTAMAAAYDVKLAAMEASTRKENQQILSGVANGLKFVVHEVVSQVGR